MIGHDTADGTCTHPLRTISKAADLAQPGDTISVHGGLYREEISPPRGGTSDRMRITYQAAPGESVEIRGSEVVKGWRHVAGDLWITELEANFFGGHNPFATRIVGDWFVGRRRRHHTAAVYMNGEPLLEAAKKRDLLPLPDGQPRWFATVRQGVTSILAQFPSADPNRELVEVNARETIIYPRSPGINFITVRGFTLSHAATNWAPPTAEQVGLIGTHWSRGWIIEHNVIRHSRCVGITLGKYGDEMDNRAQSAEGFVGTIQRALENGWKIGKVGDHTVRFNTISHCGQGGIVGSLGAIRSRICSNHIHDIYPKPRLFYGYEMAGIKLHGAIDTEISGNVIHGARRGIWLDWMAQGTRVSRNVCFDNDTDDFYPEVNHGPFLVDHNLFLSPVSIFSMSQGGAYVHNLICGRVRSVPDKRIVPYLVPHSTRIAGFSETPAGDEWFFNNLFVGKKANLSVYDKATLPVRMHGNVFLAGAKPSQHEREPLRKAKCDPAISLIGSAPEMRMEWTVDPAWLTSGQCEAVTAKRLGTTAKSGMGFETPVGRPSLIKYDYAGSKLSAPHPLPGPFQSLSPGRQTVSLKPCAGGDPIAPT